MAYPANNKKFNIVINLIEQHSCTYIAMFPQFHQDKIDCLFHFLCSSRQQQTKYERLISLTFQNRSTTWFTTQATYSMFQSQTWIEMHKLVSQHRLVAVQGTTKHHLHVFVLKASVCSPHLKKIKNKKWVHCLQKIPAHPSSFPKDSAMPCSLRQTQHKYYEKIKRQKMEPSRWSHQIREEMEREPIIERCGKKLKLQRRKARR